MLLMACATERDASITVVLDSNPAHEMREVIAVPVDPSVLSRARATPTSRMRTDSAAALTALQDSVAGVDQRFQAERNALNRESRSFTGLDRRATEYHTRYDGFRKREIAAESLRTARDRLRARVAPLEAGGGASASERRVADSAARRAIDEATSGTRRTVVTPATSDTAAVPLRSGIWWIGVARQRSLPVRWVRIEASGNEVVDLRHPATAP